jgi:hypothetical protein
VGGGSVARMERSHRIRRGDHLARTLVDRHPKWTTKITHARCIQYRFRRVPKPALPRSYRLGTPQRGSSFLRVSYVIVAAGGAETARGVGPGLSVG